MTNKLILILLLYCSFAFGQEESKLSVGLHGAPAGATLLGDFKQSKDIWFETKCRLGYVAGINFQYKLKPRVALCFEANYESKGFLMVIKNAQVVQPDGGNQSAGTDPPINIGTIRIEYMYDYITMPITFKLVLKNKKRVWFTNLGIYSAYLIRAGNRDYPIGGPRGERRYHKTNPIYINFGLVTGLGLDIPIKEHFQFSLEARNNLEFGNYLKNSYNESFALLIGLAYKI